MMSLPVRMPFIASCLLLALTSFGQGGGANLVPNPGFESGTGGPDAWNANLNAGQVWATDEVHSGKRSIKVVCGTAVDRTSGWFLDSKRRIPIRGGRTVRFSGWMKTKDIVPGSNEYQVPCISLAGYNANGEFIKPYWLARCSKGDSAWTKYEATIELRQEVEWVGIACGLLSCTGTAWFDDLELSMAEPPSPFDTLLKRDLSAELPKFERMPIIIPQPWREDYCPESQSLGDAAAVLETPPPNDFLVDELKTVFKDSGKNAIPIIPSLEGAAQFKTVLLPFIKGQAGEKDNFADIPWKDLGEEGYVLAVKFEGGRNFISLGANTWHGLLNALQTLKQYPVRRDGAYELYGGLIIDKPSLSYRAHVPGSRSLQRIDKWMLPLKVNVLYAALNPRSGAKNAYEWWVPFSEADKAQIKEWVAAVGKRFITPVAGTRPDRGYVRRIKFSSKEDVGAVLQTYRDYYECGVRSFNIAFDDGPSELEHPEDKAKFGSLAEAHYRLSNEIYKTLKSLNPANTFAVCPIYYYSPLEWTPHQREYIRTMAKLPKDVPFINCSTINPETVAAHLEIAGRKPLTWDNWAAAFEEMKPLPSVVPPPCLSNSKEMAESVSGYMFPLLDRPMIWHLAAEYMWNAERYDSDRALLRSMVKLYGAKNLRRVCEAKKFIADGKDLVFAGDSKEERLRSGRALAARLKGFVSEIKGWALDASLTKEFEDTLKDRLALVENVLLPELEGRPYPVVVPPTGSGRRDSCSGIPEEEWGKSVKLGGFLLPLGKASKAVPAKVQTEVELLNDGGSLHVRAICQEPDMASLVAKRTKHDDELWSDDCFEMMLGADDGSGRYWHLAVNPAGIFYDADKFDSRLETGASAFAVKKEGCWIAGFSIPLESIHKAFGDSGRYKFDFCRERQAGGKPECSSWTIVERRFHEPSRFWTMELPPSNGK